jgi:hypothetical protein
MEQKQMSIATKVSEDMHRLLHALSGYERKSLAELVVNLITEGLQERKRKQMLPGWMVNEEFIRALERNKEDL